MDNIFDQITQEAKKAGDFISEKAVLVKDYAIATWNAAEIRNKIDQLYKEIGKAIYEAHATGAENAEIVDEKIEELSGLKDALKEKESAKQTIRNRKVCPACGKALMKDAVFCSYCGTKLE